MSDVIVTEIDNKLVIQVENAEAYIQGFRNPIAMMILVGVAEM